MRQTDVLIIGGGILGCAATYFLSKRGIAVTLVEKGELAAEATGATTAGLTLQNRAPERYPFYCAAAERWPDLGQELGADLGFTRCGSLTVANTPDELTRLRTKVQPLQSLGLEIEWLTPAEAKEFAPWLTEELAGVSFCPTDGFVEPEAPARAFAAAAERCGATLLPQHPIKALRRDGNRGFRAITPQGEISAVRVVDAAGAWAGQIAGMLGVELPISLDPLQAMATEPRPPWLDKVVLHSSGKLTLKQNEDGRVIIGGGWQGDGDLEGGPKRLRPESETANPQLAYQAVPHLAELKIDRSWIGLEGRSPDRFPFFGEVDAVPGFYMLACVHGGFCLSTLLGDQLAELIVDGRTSFPMEKYTCRDFLANIGRKRN